MSQSPSPFSSIASRGSSVGMSMPRTRPMLARDADSMYWMARYVERAEHVARLLLVNSNLLIDVGDLAPAIQDMQWQSLLKILRLPPLDPGQTPIGAAMGQHLTLNAANPNSILSCLTSARDNARGIRENISAEMWENLNTLYWSMCSEDTAARFEDSPDDLWRWVITGSMLFQGLTDQTLAHDQRWMFAQLAKCLERVDVTCRVLETKFEILQSTENLMMEGTIRNIHWMAVLRSCGSIEAYRRNHVGDMDPMRVAMFLLLERDFPRSVRYSVAAARAAIAGIRGGVDAGGIDPAERILSRLEAQLQYAEMAEIVSEGLANFLRRIQAGIYEATSAVQKVYFLH